MKPIPGHVPAASPAVPAILRVTATGNLLIGCITTFGGAATILSGVHTLQSQDLGLGAVGLVIGLVLVGIIVVLPGILYLALSWPMRRGRAWAVRSLMSIALFHLLVVLLMALLIGRSGNARAPAVLIIAAIVAFSMGHVWFLRRCLQAIRPYQSFPRGFEPIVAAKSS